MYRLPKHYCSETFFVIIILVLKGIKFYQKCHFFLKYCIESGFVVKFCCKKRFTVDG